MMTRHNQNKSDAQLKKTLSANYINQYVNKLQQRGTADGLLFQSAVGDRLSEYMQKSAYYPQKLAELTQPLGTWGRASGARGGNPHTRRSQNAPFDKLTQPSHHAFDAASPLTADKGGLFGKYSPSKTRDSLGVVRHQSSGRMNWDNRTATSGQIQ